jgi:para-nitrobenzyl esterase
MGMRELRKIGMVSGTVITGLVLCTGAALAANPLTVKTNLGKVAGKWSADHQVREFLGIPYAAPPVGPLRWQPPQPASKWHGVRQATDFGARCMQPAIYKDMVFRDPGSSEDCLTLNVWTPAKDKHAKLPVMVWIYGGGFTTGGTSEPRQDGEHLAAHKGVLIVSMNYRLGVFGFFALSALAQESPVHAAGNYGFMDQRAALQWVQRNIARFGGDPKNVTVFGESAGSISVSAQMASPQSQGLFVRAMGESGGAFPQHGFMQAAQQEQQVAVFVRTAFGTDDLAKLRAMSAEDLLRAASKSGSMRVFWPDVDGAFLPQSVPAIYAAGQQAHVPLLAGTNQDEGTAMVIYSPQKVTLASWQAMAQQQFGKQAGEFLQNYAATNDAQALRAAEDYAGDRFIAYSTWAWLEAQEQTGGKPVYRYRFDLGSPGDPNHSAASGAFHSDDIEYVFGNLDSRAGAHWRPEDRQLSEEMQSYWTNFAKTGDPNGPGLPHWPTYNAADGWQVLHLDATTQAEPDAQRARDLFLQTQWQQPYPADAGQPK